MIALVACMAKNRVIGKENKMPWHLPQDMKFFKSITMGHIIVMGRKTFESIGRPLPGRKNVILTRDTDYQVEGCLVVHSIQDILTLDTDQRHVLIIGGEEVYRQFLSYADRLYLTIIEQDFEGDAFFPEIDESWMEVHKEKGIRNEKNPYDYFFITYEKRRV